MNSHCLDTKTACCPKQRTKYSMKHLFTWFVTPFCYWFDIKAMDRRYRSTIILHFLCGYPQNQNQQINYNRQHEVNDTASGWIGQSCHFGCVSQFIYLIDANGEVKTNESQICNSEFFSIYSCRDPATIEFIEQILKLHFLEHLVGNA